MKLYIFTALLDFVFFDMISCEMNRDADWKSDTNPVQQSKTRDIDHSEHLYMNLKLDELLGMMKDFIQPCSKENDEPLILKVEQLEQRLENALKVIKSEEQQEQTNVEKALNVIRSDISDITNSLDDMRKKLIDVMDDLNDNRQYATMKYTEMKQSLDESIKISGTTYTRWGRTTCPGNGSELTYSGYAGGSHYSHKGSAASMLCLPIDPDWEVGKYSDKQDLYVGYIYGAEYEDAAYRTDKLFGSSHYSKDVPCAMCNIKRRSTQIVIPGKTSCYPGWTREYSGYLMSGYHDHPAATDYFCVDKDPEDVPGGDKDLNGKLLYFVEAACGSLRCPPYVSGREFPCVVCTK